MFHRGPIVVSKRANRIIPILLLAAKGILAQNAPHPANAGLKAMAAGDWQRAVHDFKEALKINSQRPRVWANLGIAQANRGHFASAVQAYRKALALDPQMGPARFNLALAYLKSGDMATAARQLRIYRRFFKANDYRAALLEANCELSLHHYHRAIALAHPLLAGHGQDLGLDYVLGTAYIHAGQLQQGEVLVNRIMGQGDNPVGHLMLGDAYARNMKFALAEKQYRRAIAMNPNLPLAHQRLAETELRAGDSAAALRNFRREFALNPNDYDTNFYLGYLLRKHGHLRQSRHFLLRALAMNPRAFQPRLQLGLRDVAARHWKRAYQRLQAAIKINAGDIQAHVLLGEVDYRLHQDVQGRAEQQIVRKLTLAAQNRAAKVQALHGRPADGGSTR